MYMPTCSLCIWLLLCRRWMNKMGLACLYDFQPAPDDIIASFKPTRDHLSDVIEGWSRSNVIIVSTRCLRVFAIDRKVKCVRVHDCAVRVHVMYECTCMYSAYSYKVMFL